jgi:peptidoglycan biosynthesis protein MviN/MurJ (putative lipid II flippase)
MAQFWEWLKDRLADYFGEQRPALAAIVFSSTLTVVMVFAWKIHLKPVIFPNAFYIGATVLILVGYYLPKERRSKMLLAACGIMTCLLLLGYVEFADSVTGVTWLKTLCLFVLYGGGFGALFSTLRILMNLGFH